MFDVPGSRQQNDFLSVCDIQDVDHGLTSRWPAELLGVTIFELDETTRLMAIPLSQSRSWGNVFEPFVESSVFFGYASRPKSIDQHSVSPGCVVENPTQGQTLARADMSPWHLAIR